MHKKVALKLVYYTPMALSNKKIVEEMKKGDVVISPFSIDNLSTSSYDVTLGKFYYRERDTHNKVYNPYSKDEVEKIWGKDQLEEAKTAKEVLGDDFQFTGIRPDDMIILISPGETVLAHTEEFIGAKNHITTMMKARSSIGRNFIEVCKCAGWGDVGYINRWTMEITNNSRFHKIPIVVGRRIAQIIFFETGETLQENNDYSSVGKYQTSDNIEELQKNWSPEDMIPKMYKDYEVK